MPRVAPTRYEGQAGEVSVGNDDVSGASRIQLRFGRESSSKSTTRGKAHGGTARKRKHRRGVTLATSFSAAELFEASPKVDGALSPSSCFTPGSMKDIKAVFKAVVR
jgi:hypothetical protein